MTSWFPAEAAVHSHEVHIERHLPLQGLASAT